MNAWRIINFVICLPKWSDGATPQTAQCRLECLQCRSPVRRSDILWQIICVIRLLDY